MLILVTKVQKNPLLPTKAADFFHSNAVFLTLQAFYRYALVGFYVLNNLLVVVVCAKFNGLKGTSQYKLFDFIYCVQGENIVQIKKPSV